VTPTARIVVAGAALEGAGDPAITVVTALAAAGIPVTARVFVEDDEAALEEALAAPSDLTVIFAASGGAAGERVRRALAHVTGLLIPHGASVWATAGAAPAWLAENQGRAWVVLTPGAGLARTIEEPLVSYARALAARRPALAIRTLRTVGVEPAEVEDRLAKWLRPSAAAGDVDVTTLRAPGEVWVRLRARGDTQSAAAKTLAAVEAEIAGRLGDDCFGRDSDDLERVVGRMLAERAVMLSVAESCTGGLLGHRITNVPGSSAYFERGVMVYTNRAKQELLGVPEEILRAHGAVSGPCAEAMVRGVRRLGGSACGLAVTGIAGPDGGTPQKPVGTVWIGVAAGEHVATHRCLFDGDRASIKWQSAQAALDLLRRALLAAR